MKKILQVLLKLIIACGVLALVIHKADGAEIWKNLRSIDPQILLLALVFAFLSNIFAAMRMQVFLRPLHIILEKPYMYKIYFIGSLFNLILPTGVGGDAIKAWSIKKVYGGALTPIVKALILDRASGLLVLCLIILVYVGALGGHLPFSWFGWVMIPATFVVYFFLAKKLFGQRTEDGIAAFWYSLASQAFWCAVFMVLAKSLHEADVTVYVFLYAVAGIVGLLPITLGGLGLREMTFFYGSTWLAQHAGVVSDPERGVAMSLTYFALYVVTSALGALATAFIRTPVHEKLDAQSIQS